MSVSVLVKNACCTVGGGLGEGPHWEEKTHTLLYVDIEVGEIHRYNTITGEDSKITLGDQVGFAVPRSSGDYVVGLGRHFMALNWETKAVNSLAEVDVGKVTRMNDGKCDPSGRLWAGSVGLGDTPEEFSPETLMTATKPVTPPSMGTMYSLERDGSLRVRDGPFTCPNGLAWSSNHRKMFYIDSGPRTVYAYDFDMESGNISNRSVIKDFSDRPLAEVGTPDGMCIDTNDKLWVACFFGTGIIQVDPETGTVLQKVDIPAYRVTSCCFGGHNDDELFVTTSAFAVPSDEKAKYPLAGSVFKVTGLGVNGYPATEYAG